MTKQEQATNDLKSFLKGLITKESAPDFIEKVTAADALVDTLNAEYKAAKTETQDTKELLIKSIKSTGFKPLGTEDKDRGGEAPKTLDEVFEEASKSILKGK